MTPAGQIFPDDRVFQSKNLGGGGQIGKNRQKSRENERISKNCQKLHENERILGILWGGPPHSPILENPVVRHENRTPIGVNTPIAS